MAAQTAIVHESAALPRKYQRNDDGSYQEVVATEAVSGGGALAAGENHVGQVGGSSVTIRPTITVSATPAYSSGDVVGGKLTLTNAMRVTGGSGVLQSLFVLDKGNQKAALEVLIFNADPSQGTYTDNSAMPSLATNTTDAGKLIGRIPVAADDYVTVGSAGIADISPGGKVLVASGSRNLYAVIVTTGTPDYVTTSDLEVSFGFLQD